MQLSVVFSLFFYMFWEDASQSITVRCLPRTLQRLCLTAGALLVNKVHCQPVSYCQSQRPSPTQQAHINILTYTQTPLTHHQTKAALGCRSARVKCLIKKNMENIEWLHIELGLGEITPAEINVSFPINCHLRHH